jgi:cytochrome c biogenesis protein
VLGIFSMFYIRERRLWVWVKSEEGGQSRALMAMSSQRKTLDFEKEYEALKARLMQ